MGLFDSIFGKKKFNAEVEICAAIIKKCYLYDTIKYISFLEGKIGELPDRVVGGLDMFLQSLAVAIVIYSIEKKYQERGDSLAKAFMNTLRETLKKGGQKDQITEEQLQLAKRFFVILQEDLRHGNQMAFIDATQNLEINYGRKWEKLNPATIDFCQWVEYFINEITTLTIKLIGIAEDEYDYKPST